MKKIRRFETVQDRDKVLNDLVEKAKNLEDGEKIDATKFCNTHNIVNSLFLEVYALATSIVKDYIPHEFTEEKTQRASGKDYAIAGEKGNIIIKPPLVTTLNEKREEDKKIKAGDQFKVTDDGDVITLTKV